MRNREGHSAQACGKAVKGIYMKKRLLAGLLCLSVLWPAACAAGAEDSPAAGADTVFSEADSLQDTESSAESGSQADADGAASGESVFLSGEESGTERGNAAGSTASSADAPQEEEREESSQMAQNVFTVTVNGAVFQADFADTISARALKEWLAQGPLGIEMNDYAGFEKVGALGRSLPASNVQTTAQPGDMVLYQGNQIVLFYGTNSWSYTRLGKIADLSGWEEALGSGSVSVTFSLTE